MKGVVGRWCAAFALLVTGTAIVHAQDTPRVVSLEVCIDGLTNLHVKDGQLTWKHLAFEAPGLHSGCKGVSAVDGISWDDWSKKFPLQVPTESKTIARVMDRTEVLVRKVVAWAGRQWVGLSFAGRIVLVVIAICGSGAAAYLGFRLIRG